MRKARAFLLCLFLSACATDDAGEDIDVCFPGEKCDSFDSHGVAHTSDRMANVLSGYNPLTDRAMSPCVAPASTPSYLTGQASQTLDLVYLENRNSVTTESSTALGLDLSFMLLSAEGGFELLQHVSTKSTSLNLLVRMTADYWVMNRRRLALESFAATKLATGVDSFVKACGSHYADGVRYGGYVYALITIDTADVSTMESVRNSLGISLFGVIPLSASLSEKIVTVASSRSTSVKVHFAANGFLLDGRPASAPILSTLLGQGIGPEFFGILDHIREQLEQSVTLDKCRDSGIGSCDGVTSPGYEDNTLRNARPTGVYAGHYDRVQGIPAGLEPRLEEIAQRVEQTEEFLGAATELQSRVAKVHAEASKVLLGGTRPYFHQVAPPGRPVVRAADLLDIATRWTAVFAPDGTAARPIREALDACAVAAETLGDCASSFDGVNETIADYVASGRILPTRTSVMIGDNVSAAEAAYECSQSGGRLPTDAEARFVAPQLGLSFFTDRRFWTSAGGCGSASAALRVEGAFAESICVANTLFGDDELALICVMPDGPYPLEPAP